ncbi:MAG: hypothetical protein GXP30_10945 [Verrucomicrobia bacterium]|nr:hypothetical protein [Verrucomicrobiota bacterium]
MKSIALIITTCAFFFTTLPLTYSDDSPSNTLFFTAKGGKNPGRYGGKLSKNSVLRVQKAGGKNIVILNVVHDRDEKSTVSFAATLQLKEAFKPGKYDLKGTMSQAALLPKGTSHGGDFFTVLAVAGSGTLIVESVNTEKGSIKATFTISQGDTTISGTIDKTAMK